jgi:LmbE family N-acetylglucosaminyl deacetylase
MSIAHIYLSPHLDDAVLSCGGTIHRQTRAGEGVLVVNVCAGVPDYRNLSPFAREKHAVWGDPVDVVATRRAEDRQALAALGAQAVYWEYLDAIYRSADGRTLYPSLKALFGELDPADAELVERLAGDITALCEAHSGAMIYAPLAVGGHVDHQLVRTAALRLVQRGQQVWFYEDFPYAWWDPEGVQEALRDLEVLGDWECEVWPIDVEPKIRAIARYQTQIADLFGTEELMAEAVREYAAVVSEESGYAERFWHRRDQTT